jgi:hypothetical protein
MSLKIFSEENRLYWSTIEAAHEKRNVITPTTFLSR